jgi:rubrerythrin
MEVESRDFYHRAAQRTSDASTRELLDRLAATESGHEETWRQLQHEHLPPTARAREDAEAHRQSTLAPIFAAAFGHGRCV